MFVIKINNRKFSINTKQPCKHVVNAKTYLENNLVQSNAFRIHIDQSLNHKCHALSSQADIDRLADQWCHNLHPASQPCNNIDQPHRCHDSNTKDPNNRLHFHIHFSKNGRCQGIESKRRIK